MGFYSDSMGLYSDSMGLYSDLMGYEWEVPSGTNIAIENGEDVSLPIQAGFRNGLSLTHPGIDGPFKRRFVQRDTGRGPQLHMEFCVRYMGL